MDGPAYDYNPTLMSISLSDFNPLTYVSRFLGAGEGERTAAAGAQQASTDFQRLAEEQRRYQQEGLQRTQGVTAGTRQAQADIYGNQQPGQLAQWWQANQNMFSRPTATSGAYNQYQTSMMQPTDSYNAAGAYSNYLNSGTNTGNFYGQAANQLSQPSQTGQAAARLQPGLQGPSGTAQAYNAANYAAPGAAESFYDQNADRYNRQTSSNTAYNAGFGQLVGAGATENLRLQGPSNLQQFASGLAGMQGVPQVEQGARELQDTFRGATQSGDFANTYGRQLSFGGIGENFARDASQGLTGQGSGEQFIGSQLPGMTQQGLGEIHASMQLPGMFNTGMGEQYAGSQMPSLANRGIYEDFVAADITGDNPLLERGRQKSLAAANQELARRGQFRSGGADTMIGNILGEFEAADYQNRADRAQSAQGMQLARQGLGAEISRGAQGLQLGRQAEARQLAQGAQGLQLGRMGLGADMAASGQRLGLERLGLGGQMTARAQDLQLGRMGLGANIAGQASSEALARGGALQGLAGQRDTEQFRRIGQQMEGQSLASDENLAGSRLQLDRAMGADSQRVNRLQALGGLASGSDSAWLGQMNSQRDAANMAQQNQLQRYGDSIANAQRMDQVGLDRSKQDFNMANLTDIEGRNRLRDQYDYGMGADKLRLDQMAEYNRMAGQTDDRQQNRFNELNRMAGQVDTSELARLLGSGTMAGMAGEQEAQRMRDMWQSRLGLDTLDTSMLSQFYGNAGQMYGEGMGNSINAGANAAGLYGQGQQSVSGMNAQLAMLLGRYAAGG